jgi:hypothetical protein
MVFSSIDKAASCASRRLFKMLNLVRSKKAAAKAKNIKLPTAANDFQAKSSEETSQSRTLRPFREPYGTYLGRQSKFGGQRYVNQAIGSWRE